MIDPTELPTDAERRTLDDIIEVVWLPALLALITAASTWFIWYYTHTLCTPEIAALTGCNMGAVAEYVNVDVFGRMLTYGGLVGGIGGFWRYDMIKKERAARIAAQNQLAELQKQWQEERQGFMEERQGFMEERQELMEELAEARRLANERAAEERQQAAEERHQAAEERQQAAEDRQQAAEDRSIFLSALSELTAEIAYLRQQRNGNGNGNGQSGQ